MARTWSVYVLESATRRHLYTGIAIDVARRVALHNAGKGAKRTRAQRPWTVAWVEPGHTRSSALKRERQIKRLRRAAKLELLAGSA
jgi:putative endonuclease